MTTTQRIQAILKACGYTAATLAADLEVSRSVARRILSTTSEYFMNDALLISSKLNVSIDFLCGDYEPGKRLETQAARRARQGQLQREAAVQHGKESDGDSA